MVPNPNPQPLPACVLVVEDDVLIRALVADDLRAAGLTVLEAARADEALSYFKAGIHVDAVFSDVQMPGPIDGQELARQLRSQYPSLPVILTSGYGLASEAHDVSVFVPKPYNVAKVTALIVEIVGRCRDGAGK